VKPEKIDEIVDSAFLEGVIEAECEECGTTIHCGLDMSTAWCDNCKKQVKVNNFMQALGFV
jgi:hypothetical protein